MFNFLLNRLRYLRTVHFHWHRLGFPVHLSGFPHTPISLELARPEGNRRSTLPHRFRVDDLEARTRVLAICRRSYPSNVLQLVTVAVRGAPGKSIAALGGWLLSLPIHTPIQ